jgi:hypothetical protein
VLEKHRYSTRTRDQRQMSFDFQKKPVIIAFGFEARSGKGECCDTIYKRHAIEHGGRYKILRASFAAKLRDEIHQAVRGWMALGYGPRDAMRLVCYDAGVAFDVDAPIDALNPYGKQRRLQQWWGTEFRRAQNTDYWLNAVEETVGAFAPDVVLIDDMRFPNEHEWVRQRGRTVRTSRLGFIPISNGIAGHVSESALARHTFDYNIIVNDGELSLLREKALQVFDHVIAQKETL